MIKTRNVLFVTILVMGVLSPGCQQRPPLPNTNGPVASPSAGKESLPFTYAGETWNSQIDFVRTNARCGTPDPPEDIKQKVEAELERAGVLGKLTTTVISVAVHVITEGPNPGDGRVTKKMIDDQIDALNKAFAGSLGSGTTTSFQFKLGGYEYTLNPAWYKMVYGSPEEKAAKTALQVPGKNILNIYTGLPRMVLAGSPTPKPVLGFASFPWDYSTSPVLDGVVISYQTLPGVSPPTFPYGLGLTAAHETGHWMGLYHTFMGGCTNPNDYVADTAQIKDKTAGCPTKPDTCPSDDGPDQIENFMDYTDDACVFKFTLLQSSRMDSMYIKYRQ